MNKIKQLRELYTQWEGCRKCGLSEKRKHIVFGRGNPDADIVILGIAPGEQEDRSGEPFCGDSGDILNEFLRKIRIERDDLFVMNLVGCRPTVEVTDPVSGRKKTENRDPSKTERGLCQQLWLEALYIVDPMLIVALGKPVMSVLADKRGIQMHSSRGKIYNCTFPGVATTLTYPVMCMYHPAFLARTGDKTYGGVWHQAIVDWYRASHYIDQLHHLYQGKAPPDRGYTVEDMFLYSEEVDA